MRPGSATNDLEATIEDWSSTKVPIWGVIPERVGIASGPASRIYREGLEAYQEILRKVIRARSADPSTGGQGAPVGIVGGAVEHPWEVGVPTSRPIEQPRCRWREHQRVSASATDS